MSNETSEAGYLYCDSSALVKLIVDDKESRALRAFVGTSGVATSEVVLAELPRAMHRRAAGNRGQLAAEQLIERLTLIAVTRGVLLRAGAYAGLNLRSLDAIHIASVQESGRAIAAFISYDRQQLRVAQGVGLPVHSPA